VDGGSVRLVLFFLLMLVLLLLVKAVKAWWLFTIVSATVVDGVVVPTATGAIVCGRIHCVRRKMRRKRRADGFFVDLTF
jgi:hypothetical protein